MVKRYLRVCEFSDGKGVKEEKRWAPEWGGIWGPKSCGNRPSGPVSQRVEVRLGQESALKVNNRA